MWCAARFVSGGDRITYFSVGVCCAAMVVMVVAALDWVRRRDVHRGRAHLAPEAVCVTDSGVGRPAARRPILGAPRVTQFLINLAQRFSGRLSLSPVTVNGDPGFVLSLDGTVDQVIAFETEGNQVMTIRIVGNPAKLQRTDDPPALR